MGDVSLVGQTISSETDNNMDGISGRLVYGRRKILQRLLGLEKLYR